MALLAVVDQAYAGLEPLELWRHFSALNRIPRPSRSEERAAHYVREIAEAAGASWEADQAGNTVVRVAATSGHSDAPIVAIQAHLDMVCDSDPDVVHDWEADPIVPRRDGHHVMASGTTLGADNGVGVAAALALLTTPGVRHGPLELVFTVEEETGLRGAMAFDAALLEARLLLNLDGEDARCLEIGSSGTQDIAVELPVSAGASSAPDALSFDVVLSGLRGGHSGTDIRHPHANALKLLVAIIRELQGARFDIELARLVGGKARNAIPRSAQTTIVLAGPSASDVADISGTAIPELLAEWDTIEPDRTLSFVEAASPSSVLTPASTEAVLAFLERAPHGVLAVASDPDAAVRTSCNLARAEVADGSAAFLLTSRSHVAADQEDVYGRIAELAGELGGSAAITSGYPPWSTDGVRAGGLLALAVDAYTAVNGRSPALEAVDGGLECGVIAAKVPGMQAVSFGPLITGAHTPRECIDASTVPAFWRLLVELLDAVAGGAIAPSS